DRLIFVTGVFESITPVEANPVGAVPEQAFLAVIKIKSDIYVAAFQRELRGHRLLSNGFNLEAILSLRLFFRHLLRIESRRRDLVLRRAPGRGSKIRPPIAEVIGSLENCRAQDGPGH